MDKLANILIYALYILILPIIFIPVFLYETFVGRLDEGSDVNTDY